MVLELRNFRPDDYPAVTLLWEDLGLGGAHRGDTPDIIEATLACGGHLLVLEEEGALIGSAWVTCDGRRLHLHHVGVARSHQGRGLGARLTQAILALAQERRLQVKLEVGRSNVRAQELYRRLGFQPLGDYEVLIDRRPGCASLEP